jgi:zinc finger SWIM domain-containing protein 3
LAVLQLHFLFAGADVELILRDENIVTAIYFQTTSMKRTYAAFPDVLMIDATYKLNALKMPLYVLMAIDGNGMQCILFLFFQGKNITVSIDFNRPE